MTETQPSSADDVRTDSRPRPVHGADAHGDPRKGIRQRVTGDDRGQSELLGAILLFGLAIAVLVLIQVAAVPAWNQAIEFEHNQRLNEDFDRMGQVISDVAGDGGDRSVAVELGVRYPTRPFLFNPGPATGQIQTTDVRTVYINNSQVAGAEGYWEEDSMAFNTRSIQYNPSYNEYRDAPETTYEYGRVIREFPNDYNTSDEAVPIIDGTNINLIYVNGRLSEATSTTKSIPIEGTSAPSNGVRLSRPEGETGNIELRIPSEYPERLKNRLDEEQGSGTVISTSVDGDAVVAQLNGSKTYNLRMSRIEVGPSNYVNGPEYITPERGQTTFFSNNSIGQLTVDVRDDYNNPVAGETVEFEIDSTDASCVDDYDRSATTDEDGKATIDIVTSAQECDDVVMNAELADDSNINTTFTFDTRAGGIRATPGDEGEGGAEDGVSELNPDPSTGVPVFSGLTTDPNGEFAACFYNPSDTTDYNINQTRVSFYFTTQGVGQTPTTVNFLDSPSGFDPLPSPFVFISGTPVVSENTNSQTKIALDFENGDAGPSDFFVISIRYDVDDGSTDTYSYLVTPPQGSLSPNCPNPPS